MTRMLMILTSCCVLGCAPQTGTTSPPTTQSPEPSATPSPPKKAAPQKPPAKAEIQALTTSLLADLKVLVEDIGERHAGRYDALTRTSAWIEKELRGAGLVPVKQTFRATRHGGQARQVSNLVVEIPGVKTPKEIVVVGAHYDTAVGTPGADDNATGVVAALALARQLATYKPERTLRIVFFVNEEPPFFHSEEMGSLVYARACRARGEKIVSMMSLEMLGYYTDAPDSQTYPPLIGSMYPSTGHFLAFVSDTGSRGLVRDAARAFRVSGFPAEHLAAPQALTGVTFSDQWSFWQVGYPAIMVTDTSFMRNPHYHESTDTIATLDLPRLAHVVYGLGLLTKDWTRAVKKP